jgi:hypothetical protein
MFRVLILFLLLFAPPALAEGFPRSGPSTLTEDKPPADRCARMTCRLLPETPKPEDATALCCDNRWSHSANRLGTQLALRCEGVGALSVAHPFSSPHLVRHL